MFCCSVQYSNLTNSKFSGTIETLHLATADNNRFAVRQVNAGRQHAAPAYFRGQGVTIGDQPRMGDLVSDTIPIQNISINRNSQAPITPYTPYMPQPMQQRMQPIIPQRSRFEDNMDPAKI